MLDILKEMAVCDEVLSSNGYFLMSNGFITKDEVIIHHDYERDVNYSTITAGHIVTQLVLSVTLTSILM